MTVAPLRNELTLVEHKRQRVQFLTVAVAKTFCFSKSGGGVFPLQIAGDFLSSPGDILLSELWLSGKTSFQWPDLLFSPDYYIWLMQTLF